MKTITSGFKESLTKLGREIDFKFSLHTNDKIITENGKFLMTQANQHLVVEQFDDTEIDETITAEDIYSVSIVNRGSLLSTMMKELDFELSHDLRIGDIIDCEFGIKVNNSYEYINYGSYMVYSKEYNEDTKTFNYVAYDRMLLTMQEANQDFLTSLENKTLAYCIHNICETVGLNFTATQEQLTTYPNLNKQINEGTFTDLQITYRDILDMICQALGLSMITNEKNLILKPLDDTIKDTFDEEFLKSTNVSFGKKFGKVNSVVLSRSEDTDNIYRRDEESIAQNGLCEYKIKDNLIMLYNDREDYIDEIFEQLNGLEYYETDFESTGITYLDWLDFYNIQVGDNTYKCLMLNDEIKIDNGLEENIYCEEPEQTVIQYKTSSKTDKEVSFIVDKQNGSINAKVSKGDVINQINLDESGVEINAEKINLNGVVTANNNFKIKQDGSMEALNGSFSGNIQLYDNGYGNDSYFRLQKKYSNNKFQTKNEQWSNYIQLENRRNESDENPEITTSIQAMRNYSMVGTSTDKYRASILSSHSEDSNPRAEMFLDNYNDQQAKIGVDETNSYIKIKKGNDVIDGNIGSTQSYLSVTRGSNQFNILLNDSGAMQIQMYNSNGSQTVIHSGAIYLKDSNGNTKTITPTS